jgi:uncharacterized protein (TIGR00290 family)
VRRAVLSWSSGKDSAYALHAVRGQGEVEVVGLLTSVGEEAERVAIHGVRREVLRAQAASLGFPLWEVPLPAVCPKAVYEARMAEALSRLREEGIGDVVFGDIHLADVRAYREAQIARAGLAGHFPLWGRETGGLAREMLGKGMAARVVTLDPERVPAGLAGARFDRAFLEGLPEGVDRCGENGEFHTLVTDGPGFERPLRLEAGEVVERNGYVYADFALAGEG